MMKHHKKKFSWDKDPNLIKEREKYASPAPSRAYILEYMNAQGRPVSHVQLIRAFELRQDEERIEGLRRRLLAMVRDGQLLKNRRAQFVLVSAKTELLAGKVVGHRDGFGFVVPEKKSVDNLFISAQQMQRVLPGDSVLVREMPNKYLNKTEGMIVEILKPIEQLVGCFFKQKKIAFVSPYDPTIAQDILIPEKYMGARNGQYVVVRLLTRPSRQRQATGEVIQILGDQTAPHIEQQVIVQSYQLPDHWTESVKEELAQLGSVAKALRDPERKDMRELPFITIDGESAQDFDDAVYCKPLPLNKGWRLYVAIADVTHYVKPDQALDQSAYQRGTSVYFPGQVLPMLPEVLSNGLCSLLPNVDRLVMVCEMCIGRLGRLVNYNFHFAVIRSKARLTYTQVWDDLRGEPPVDRKPLLKHLKALRALYKTVQRRRERSGALEFDTTETNIILNQQGKIEHILPSPRNQAHCIIEVCMLLANVAAARCLIKHDMRALFRTHAGPEVMKLEKLREFLNAIGVKLSGGMKPSSKDYAKLLKSIKGRADQAVIESMILRSLSKAVYTPNCPEHFGLAYREYCQFTSPIRRYPDILVHRALKHILLKKGDMKTFHYSLEALETFGKHCSETERRADQAETDVVDWLKCKYVHDKLGQAFMGIVVNITPFGLFVQLDEIYVKGLLHISNLATDYYHFDAVHHHLVGANTGKVYRIGDSVNVIIASVDLDQRNIDFQLTGLEDT